LISIGILCILNFMFLNSYSNFDLNNTEKIIIVATNILLMVLSLMIHEIGHLIGSSVTRIRIKNVIMGSFGGLLILDCNDLTHYKNRAVLFLLGPITSISVGISIILMWHYYSGFEFLTFPIKETLENSLALIGVFNLLIGLVNLFPALPFDSGVLIEYYYKRSKISQNRLFGTFFKSWNFGFYLFIGSFILYLTISDEQYTLLLLFIYLVLLYQDTKNIHSINNNSPIRST